MNPFLVDVPVKINIWTRVNCQKKQFEVIKQARPSILFLQSDGGRNDDEWKAIRENRKLYDEGIDWECTVYKLYEDKNNGLYSMINKTYSFVWEKVDRCIFLEDDYVPAVTFFRFCAELLEKYKDDQRIQQICGNNVFGVYKDAEPFDYFFTENGWSIWGTATWRDRDQFTCNFPLPYGDDNYIKRCLKTNLTYFWYRKVEGYIGNEKYENHLPGPEYFNAINSALYHRLSIVPTKNMISNIGFKGAHANIEEKNGNNWIFGLQTYEIGDTIKHPTYIIDDKYFSHQYEKYLGHKTNWAKEKARVLKRFVFGLFNKTKKEEEK